MAARGSLKNAEGALRKRAQTSITKTNTTLGVPNMGRAHVGLQPNRRLVWLGRKSRKNCHESHERGKPTAIFSKRRKIDTL